MSHRSITAVSILLFLSAVLIFTSTYGPSRRNFAAKPRVVNVTGAAEINKLWEESGVRGRIAVLFTRHLNAEQSGINYPEIKYIELAMRHGIVRTVYYIVPDNIWPTVYSENLQRKLISPPKIDAGGFVMLFEEGRVNVLPLSKFWPPDETMLTVIEPAAWGRDDLMHISRLISSGRYHTDILALIRGTQYDGELFNDALALRSPTR